MTTLLLLLATIGQCQGGRCPAPTQARTMQSRVPVAPYYPPGPTPTPVYVPGPPPATPMKAKDMTATDDVKAKIVAAGYKVSNLLPADPRHIASYDWDAGEIRINVWDAYWNDRARSAELNYRVGHMSTPHPDHIMRHEFGHAELHRAVGTARMKAINKSPLPLPADRIKAVVSTYAANSTIDFHAEVYAGLKDGRAFPADVLNAYAAIMRPR
jgi:hypothetical protein